jgi:uncharacterized protein involved in exopolysaccharide biosynthesis
MELDHVQALVGRLPDERDETPGEPEPNLTERLAFDIIRRSWWLLWLFPLLGLLAAIAYSARTPDYYTAQVLLAPIVARTDVQFEPRIRTVDANTGDSATTLTPERRQALADLVQRSDVEGAALQQLQGKVPSADLGQDDLLSRVKGVLMPRSELIAIQVDDASPDNAVAIANAWAQAYADRVNAIYAGEVAGTPLQTLIDQRDAALRQMQAAQGALAESVRGSRLEELDQQIQSKELEVQMLQAPNQSATIAGGGASPTLVPTVTPGTPNGPNAGTAAGARTLAITTDPAAMTRDYRLQQVQALDDMAQTLRKLEATQQNIRALLQQEQDTGPSASTAAALAIIKAQLVSISDGLPNAIQLQLPSGATGETLADLRHLSDGINAVHDQLANEFEMRRGQYEARVADQLRSLAADLRQLRADREAANSERQNLTTQRDLAVNTYNALAAKVEERRIADASGTQEVQIASMASVAQPAPRKNLVIALGLLLGLVAGFTVALGRSIAADRTRAGRSTAARRDLVPTSTRT